jgi:hypothetical protein
MEDEKIVNEVINEWRRGSGASMTVNSALRLLLDLGERYGNDFSLEEACKALDDLSSDARSIKRSLVKAKGGDAALVAEYEAAASTFDAMAAGHREAAERLRRKLN